MNIAFDAVAILGPMSRNRGIGNYAFSQFTGMVDLDTENHYFFLNMLDKDFRLSDHLTHPEHLTEVVLDTGKHQVLLREPACAEVIGAAVRRFLDENKIDIFYITSPFESCFTPYRKEWFKGVRVVMTVYDIIPYVMKHQYLRDENTRNWYMQCVENLRWADALYVISESVKTDLIRHLHFPAEQISVIWGAVDEKYHITDISETDKQALFRKFGITKPFVMCTGGEDGRKNIDGLIRAFSLLPGTIRAAYQLVVVCKLSEPALQRLRTIAEEHHVGQDVIFTNFVTDEELRMCYQLAELMAFPSKYEGFGLPIVEAWGCGTAVLTANNSSLKEIAGDAAMLVNADSDRSIADGMAKLLTDAALREDYARRGTERVERFRWNQINADIIALLNKIVPCEKAASAPEHIRIAFFTPLPPMESGISDYSEDIITALSRYCDIDVFTDKGYTPSSTFPDNVQIFPHTDYPARRESYCDTVYQMGNSDFHFYMYPYLRQFHGTMVLHDYNLHGAFYHHAIAVKKDTALYQTYVSADAPHRQADAAAPDIYGLELNSYLTNAADRIIVHSHEAKRKLLRNDVARNVTVIPSYAVITPLSDSRPIKEKYGVSPDAVVLAAFGGIHSTKRPLPILKAFAVLHRDFPTMHLFFVGKLSEETAETFRNYVKEQGLQDCVTVTGHVSIAQFKEMIDMTDICLNLRYPSNGETSGSLMRILARGKCVVVNDIGSFSELPEDICIRLPSVADMGEANEPEQLIQALRPVIEDADRCNAIGQAARVYAESHLDLRLIAEQYFRLLTRPVRKSVVTEDMLRTLRQNKDMLHSDICGIAGTIAYAAGEELS